MTSRKLSKGQKQRFDEAAKHLEEIQKKFAPYLRPMRIEDITIKGLWEKSSDSVNVFTRDSFYEALKKVALPAQGQPSKEK